MENQLLQVIDQSGVEQSTALTLKDSFLPFFKQADEWAKKAKELVVTNENQRELMYEARRARLALKEIRIAADKKRKELKEDSIRYGKAVQGVYNVIEYLISPTEKYLEEQEKFIEIQEQKRKQALKEVREKEVEPYLEFLFSMNDLSDMTEEDYQKYLNMGKKSLQDKIDNEERIRKEAEEKAKLDKLEYDRRLLIAPYAQFLNQSHDLRNIQQVDFDNLISKLQQSKIEYDKEQERIKADNERLAKEKEEIERKAKEEREKADKEKKALEEKVRKEKEAAEAKAKKEKEAVQAKLKAEHDAKLKLEKELQAKKDAEEAEKKRIESQRIADEKARLEAEKKAKNAPDKEKLLRFAELLGSLERPVLKSIESQQILESTVILINKINDFIKKECEKL